MNPDRCKACNAAIYWAITPSGARQPIDHGASEQGNILLVNPSGLGELLAVALSKDALTLARARPVMLRMPHHATCPDVQQFRKAS